MKTRTKIITLSLAVLLLLAALPGMAFAQGETDNQAAPQHRPQPNCQRQLRLARSWLATAAETLGLEPAELRALLKEGGTPAEIAEGSGSSGQALIDAIVAAEKARLDQAVAEGKITQVQADRTLARHTQAVTRWVNEGKNPVAPQCRRKTKVVRHWLKTAAETVGMPVKDFAAALREGQTPGQIANANGSSGQAIIDAIVADAKVRLDQAVADGKITQEKADKRLTQITEKVSHWVENGFPERPDTSKPA